MALLENITYSPGEPMQNAFDKINDAIDKINSVLGGGTTDQIIRKIDGTDFNFQFDTLPDFGSAAEKDSDINWQTIDIGDWDMDTNATITVNHTLDITKIRSISVLIRKDSGTGLFGLFPLNYDATGSAGYFFVQSTLFSLGRTTSGIFDSTDFNSTSYNRGWIIIGYTD